MLQNTGISDAGLSHVRAAPISRDEHRKHSHQRRGDDALSKRLTKLRHLDYLGEQDHRRRHRAIERICADLQTLDIAVTQISDGGLEHIAVLSNLNILTLAWTRITDRGLAHLKRLTKLSSVDLTGTQVTDAGVKELMRALPRLTIER